MLVQELFEIQVETTHLCAVGWMACARLTQWRTTARPLLEGNAEVGLFVRALVHYLLAETDRANTVVLYLAARLRCEAEVC